MILGGKGSERGASVIVLLGNAVTDGKEARHSGGHYSQPTGLV